MLICFYYATIKDYIFYNFDTITQWNMFFLIVTLVVMFHHSQYLWGKCEDNIIYIAENRKICSTWLNNKFLSWMDVRCQFEDTNINITLSISGSN